MAMRASSRERGAQVATASVSRGFLVVLSGLLLIAVLLVGEALSAKGHKARDFTLSVNPVTGQIIAGKTGPSTLAGEAEGLPSNSVIDLEIAPPYLWIATGNGLGRFEPVAAGPGMPDLADQGAWFVATEDEGFGRGGVSAVTVGEYVGVGEIVWAATAFDSTVSSGDDLPTGGGVGYSLDDGESWTWLPQPQDELADTAFFKPTVTPVQNVTYDIGILYNRVWTASWGGGLRYLDMPPDMPDLAPDELEWVNRPPDDQSFNVLARNNHRAFSIATMLSSAAPGEPVLNDPLIWVGTAQGINLSRDNGTSWTNFRFDSGNDATPNGDFVPALGAQMLADGRRALWAGCWVVSAEAGQFYGASMTLDEGVTWQRVLGSVDEPIRVHNFAFQDTIAYAATEFGLYKTADFGQTWARFPNPVEIESREEFYEDEVFSAAYGLDRLWVGGPEGLGISVSGGNEWAIERSAQPVLDDDATYAYPNPFSPQRFPVVRLHYKMAEPGPVTVEIYDFAMEILARPINGESRPAGEHDEIWNGRAAGGAEIANGVYFYRIEGGGEERWGKILLLD